MTMAQSMKIEVLSKAMMYVVEEGKTEVDAYLERMVIDDFIGQKTADKIYKAISTVFSDEMENMID